MRKIIVTQEAVSYDELTPKQQQQRLRELAVVFLRLGAIAFGGPAAHIAMMDNEVVNRRRWMSREKLLDLLGITNLIPGPNSTELAIHIGYEQGGWRGLLVAGSCFILPAMLIVWILAAIYDRYQTVPQVGWLLYGIKPVIVAIVLQAVWNLGKKAAKDLPTRIAGVIAVAAYFAGLNEILLLILLGVAVMVLKNWHNRGRITGAFLLPFSGILAQVGTTTAAVTSVTWLSVFLFFLKIGCILYGSGYVLLAFLQRDLVERNQWLTSQQLLDAVAIGQFTPGPVFTTATFIGYLLAGNAGAIAGTIGIFLPAFLLVWVVNPWVTKLRQSPWASGFLDGVNAASLGLMVGVTYTLGQTALVDWLTIILAIMSAIAVFRFKINSAWLVLAGGAIGFASHIF
ncbi:chromate transporter [Trichormus variabilis ARAD]|uniref:Chromate transporter n=1 Tax=Trichormus variabilis N2B TaxID=2681315 RepID=A0ABR6SBC2_ANAVA|nr:chromate transporter [Trichormus variabilis ARAD]MBC1258387.1 chromate transporter [Trichormus variabilis V5]MBC1267073.1 chromate transporter [Trichormus variabilis FSR]MBC1303711.1 chromate transporter [Trichormus variabilis N2B]MBC1314096.1 chromate transporter [Trichormus variabilis PNB]MBC1327926.1 chromate transporter [Trichormus variabilis 9RC]MBD2383668.1 chromate transporter [Trichormus variabilis FACHB-319]QFZ15399.1 chromate transporter [Anabaena sp. YBS01]QHD83303.1 chromate 